MHDHGLLAIHKQISHNYSESLVSHVHTHSTVSNATSSNKPYACK